MSEPKFATTKEMFDQLEFCHYEAIGGPLELNVAYIQLKQRIAMLESQLEAANEDAAFLSRALHTLYNDTGESYTIVEKAQEQHKSRIQEAQNG
jgi:lipid II:glycine glycyltransferase (peptidoglycan interpeptide bridge formation enzyme)